MSSDISTHAPRCYVSILGRFAAVGLGLLCVMTSHPAHAFVAPEQQTQQTAAPAEEPTLVDAQQLARDVTIYRDEWGVPHIDGKNDAAAIFGLAYCQAEDYFWQVEDTYILSLGRYSEVHGITGLNSDLLNHAFEVVKRSREDFATIDPEIKALTTAFTEGLNYYLAKHPEVKPRLITHFEPWHVLALGRHLTLELCIRYTRVTGDFLPRSHGRIYARRGSNGWAIAPSKTKDGNAMLLLNPHQPWFGFGQWYECHMRSGQEWNFSGATFFGNPMPGIGHNGHLGWTFTTNEPDIADVWTETFDDPNDPLNYRYGDGYRKATEWTDVIGVKKGKGIEERPYTFMKTHHGPIIRKESDTQFLSARIARLYDAMLLRQILKAVRAENLDQFRDALSDLNFQIMNVVYADRHGDIFYLYNGIIPRRNARFDWSKPVDGSDPRTEWQGFHPLEELPQVLNPPSGYVQNCNSTPFTTTDVGNPYLKDFPRYMVEEKHDDKRRAKLSRMLLREMHDVTFDQWKEAAFDTTIYWPLIELPRYERHWQAMQQSNPQMASQVEPYLKHLLEWDCVGRLDSTATTLCVAWYEELYGASEYPGETLNPHYVGNVESQFRALIRAATKLNNLYGDWRVAWGDVHRIQRHPDVADFVNIPFDDKKPSLPCPGIPSPLGAVFVTFYTPPIPFALGRTMKKQYGVVGTSYVAAVEFGDRVQAASALQFGQSSDPHSPHYMDQAQLFSEKKLKPAYFYWDDVQAHAKRVYRPDQP